MSRTNRGDQTNTIHTITLSSGEVVWLRDRTLDRAVAASARGRGRMPCG
jgi:hypothetical protein